MTVEEVENGITQPKRRQPLVFDLTVPGKSKEPQPGPCTMRDAILCVHCHTEDCPDRLAARQP